MMYRYRIVLLIFYISFLHAYRVDTDVIWQFENNKDHGSIDLNISTRATNVGTFYNIIAQNGADPWVYKHTDGWYYMTRTTGINVKIWRSRTLTSINGGESIVAWTPPKLGAACKEIWAPEIHFVRSAWYVYFSATTCDNDNNNHRMFVIENTNPDPFKGTFTWKGKIHDSTDKWAIDGTVFENSSGSLYFIWSGWEGNMNGKQNLYIAQMSNPWTISSERLEIATPTYPWETNHSPHVNEGPEVTIRNGVISLVYSASGSWTNDYCLGLITALNSSDLMKPSSWHKHSTPIFKSANNVFGPGHHSLTTSSDGKEDWIVYHSARYSGSGWTRQVHTQKFTWNADSTPNLGEPMPRNTPIPIPSGEPLRDRYEVEDGRLLNGSSVIKDSTASNNMKVGYIDHPSSTVIVTVQCAKAGTYMIIIRDGNGTKDKADATHRLWINNGTEVVESVVYSGWDMWGASMIRANLNQGANTLTFKKGENFAELDEIDIFPVD